MKEILQTKVFKSQITSCLCICSFLYLHSYHVENVARIDQTIEVEEPEAEYQEEQLPGEEHEVANQVEEQFPEANLANSDPQQGKHRFIQSRVLIQVQFYTIFTFMLMLYVYRSYFDT